MFLYICTQSVTVITLGCILGVFFFLELLPKKHHYRVFLGLRKHDVCFLIRCQPKAAVGTKYNITKPFKEQIDVTLVRGCEIEGMLDSEGKVIEEYGTSFACSH